MSKAPTKKSFSVQAKGLSGNRTAVGLGKRALQDLPGDWWVITISVYGDAPTCYIHAKRYSERAGNVNGAGAPPLNDASMRTATHKKPECFGNTLALVPLLRSLIAGGKEPDIQRSLSAPLAPVPASSASATYASNMITDRRTFPAFMLAKPSLISGNLMRAEIQSSRCRRPLR
jgi:hypothetical protein